MLYGMTTKCLPTCRKPTASEECHCTKCHNNFYTVKAFDEHRNDPDSPENQNVDCWMPEDCGLILEKEMWAFPAEHEKRRSVEAKLAKARAARGMHD